jgi:hypothetical protein
MLKEDCCVIRYKETFASAVNKQQNQFDLLSQK